jgi:glycosyltransferase involved in cell wall biosynthesis
MIGVLIPASHAGESLAQLLAEVLDCITVQELLVIDDGSQDMTPKVCADFGVDCFCHEQNQGKGAALKRGYAIWERRGAEAVITLDADGQHVPAEMEAFRQAWRDGAQLVIGDRNLGRAKMSPDRRLSNRTSTWLLNRRTGLSLVDSQCGYRLLDMKLWKDLSLFGSHFDLESEVVIQAARLGAVIQQVPVSQRPAREASSINRFRDSLRFLRCLGRTTNGSL